MTKWVYAFGGGRAEGKASMRELLGGKGANLAEMSVLGLPVPPGFTITTQACNAYYEGEKTYPEDLRTEVEEALSQLEQVLGKRFGNPDNPLLVSVRSGARASMPGMMDTVLNLGLNDETTKGLARLSGDGRFAYDSYRRFIHMYADVVLGVDHHLFEEALEAYKDQKDYVMDTDLKAADWEHMANFYKKIVETETGHAFPQNPREQLWGALGAVFNSWMNARAITYRRLHDIPQSWGTAVTVQAMVFGNMGEDCATGVAFTRNPSTGEKEYYGEFLINAQGEDVVAGIRTPMPLTRSMSKMTGSGDHVLEDVMPEVYAQLEEVFTRLERHYRDMQDIEFTVEKSQLWMLQTRSGKRTAQAALKIAVAMAEEGLISEEEAVLRLDPTLLDQLLHPMLDPKARRDVLAKGLPASPGAGVGRVVLTADEAEALAKRGEKVVLVREETSPEDIHGMHAAAAILTARGGMTSHAAVVARGMGRPCVCGVGSLRPDPRNSCIHIGNRQVKAGDFITIDGGSGEVLLGVVDMVQPSLSGDFLTLMNWADKARHLKVRTNAETPSDVSMAKKFGAEGIGLCRTEHMFFDPQRIMAIREAILAREDEARGQALAKLLPHQRQDFLEIFQIMETRPCTIRLLDPPLHEFLPHADKDIKALSESLNLSFHEVEMRVKELAEANPMLGHRGCRLGITFPEIYEMQARAIFEAQLEVASQTGKMPQVEIMIPLAATEKELAILKNLIERVAVEVSEEKKTPPSYLFGAMAELPRAVICADELARQAVFFSFGTNDLTQTSFGLSRDDAGKFLPFYVDHGIMEKDPFVSLDLQGVGTLMQIGAERARMTRPDVKLGICGEHGGDPASIAFCHDLGLDYVSCSPYRVPIARLAAAQAALRQNKRN